MGDPLDSGDIWAVATANTKAVLGGIGLGHLPNLLLFVGAFLLLSLIGWCVWHRREEPGGFFRFLFPARIWRHPSTRHDAVLTAINLAVSPFSAALAVATGGWLAHATSVAVSRATDWNPGFSWDVWSIAGLTLALALVSDLATYVVHRLHHAVPWLWEFHKVHHSAEVLSPLTIFRKHPVFDLCSRMLKALLVGPLMGLVFALFAGPVGVWTAMGTNAVYAAFHLGGAGLRHSHVWVSYGPLVEHVFISPAQHQIHHSREPRHWDRNFGQVFALWDWIFGSLYVPRGREEFRLGVDGAPSSAYGGLVRGFVRPFSNAWTVFRAGRRKAARAPVTTTRAGPPGRAAA